MAPNAPIKNFKLPRLADNGYTQWVLKGGTGIYDGPEQVRIEGMGLRVYTGDERMALEMTMDSPQATVRIQENKAFSESTIEIVGSNFKISGVGWTWDGATKEIEVLFDVVVQFSQNIADTLGTGTAKDADIAPKTVIHSQRLKLTTTATEYQFEFKNNVHAVSGDMDLECDVLIALVDAPEGRKEDRPKIGASKLDSVRQIIARDKVVIKQQGRIVRAGEAEFFPREKKVNLSGTPQVEAPGVNVSGATIRVQEGEIVVSGGGDSGRAQMILTETGGLGMQGGSALGEETIVLADSITMLELETENQFLFVGSVEVMSGAVQMLAKNMTIFADKSADDTKVKDDQEKMLAKDGAENENIKVGDVRKIVAGGGVRMEQDGQIANSERVTFYPVEGRAVLEGTPRVEASGVYISGATIRIQEGDIVVSGGGDSGRAQMILTETGGLGIQGGTALGEETIVLADSITMLELETENQFLFVGSVEVMSGAVQMLAKNMTIFADKSADDGKAKDDNEKALSKGDAENVNMKVGDVRKIVADGGVRIEQSGQIATSERVTFYPVEERAVIEGSPRVTNGEAIVTGEKMELKPGLAIIRGSETKPVNVILPEMPNLGYDAFTGVVATADRPKPLEPKQNSAPSETIVSSQLLRMLEEPTRTVFRFTENVKVTATNLEASCDLLDVLAVEKKTQDAKSGAIKDRLEVQRIEAVDNVVVKQDGRVATADNAFILPQEGKVILEGNAVVDDPQGRVSGHRMILLQGQRRAIVEGGGPDGARARITLPALPKGKF